MNKEPKKVTTKDHLLRFLDLSKDLHMKWKDRPGIVETCLRIGSSLHDTIKYATQDNTHPVVWLEREGFHPAFKDGEKIVHQALQSFDMPFTVIHSLEDSTFREELAEIRNYKLGELEIQTVAVIGPYGTEIWPNVFSADTENAEDLFRKWFWDIANKSVLVDKIVKAGAYVPIFRSFETFDRDYIGPWTPKYLYDYWQDFRRKGFSRCLLFIGPPGTGKSSVARGMAKMAKGNILHIGPFVLGALWDANTVKQAFDLLHPEVLLIDDIHGIPQEDIANVLSLLEMINDNAADTLVIGTANEVERIDKAIRRPGRFDQAFEFSPPDKDEWRQEIFEHYSKEYDCEEKTSEMMDFLLKSTKGLTPAYLKETSKTICAMGHRDDLFEFLEKQFAIQRALFESGFEDDEALVNGTFTSRNISKRPIKMNNISKGPS